MPFNAKQFCADHNLPTAPSGHQHFRQGWVNIPCPYCSGNPGFHLGLNAEKAYCTCYRCGSHWLPKVVSTILKISISQAKAALKPYLSGEQTYEFKEKHYAEKIIFPSDTGPMTPRQRTYLESRNFDPDKLEQEWGLLGVGAFGTYKNRILAPIYLHNQLISYQTRDITGKSPAKYMACSEEEEVYCHKYTLYGIDNCASKTVIITEGIFDVWRFGRQAVCLFGISYKPKQAYALARIFREVIVVFDSESQAIAQAKKLSGELRFLEIESKIIILMSGDPAQMTQEEAKRFIWAANLSSKTREKGSNQSLSKRSV